MADFGSPVQPAVSATGEISLQLHRGGLYLAKPSADQPEPETGIIVGGIQLDYLAKINQSIREMARIITETTAIVVRTSIPRFEFDYFVVIRDGTSQVAFVLLRKAPIVVGTS
jgi:hypothetical protein